MEKKMLRWIIYWRDIRDRYRVALEKLRGKRPGGVLMNTDADGERLKVRLDVGFRASWLYTG